MGLTPDMVPGDLRLEIYQKLGITPDNGGESKQPKEKEIVKKQTLTDAKTLKKLEEKRSKKRQQARSEREEQQRLALIKESDLVHSTDGIGGNERISMSDVLNSIDTEKFAAKETSNPSAQKKASKSVANNETINTGKLRKQMRLLKKEVDKHPALQKPVSGRKRVKQEQKANYEINAAKLGVYLPQVKRAREEVQSDFTTADKLLHGGKVTLNSLGQIAANLDTNKSGGFSDQLEQQVQAELQRQGLKSEKDMKAKEMEALGSKLDSKQIQDRYNEISKLRSLLFKSELKNRRVSKIKSKLYHKIKKRDKDREEKKLKDHLELIDPEAASVYREKEELKKVEERLRVRHGAQSKFAKNLKRFRNMDDKQTRDQYHQLIQERNLLVQKTKKVARDDGESDSDSNGDSQSSDNGSSDEGADRNKALKDKTVKRMQKEMDESSDEEEDSEGDSDDSEGESDGKLNMRFDENSK